MLSFHFMFIVPFYNTIRERLQKETQVSSANLLISKKIVVWCLFQSLILLLSVLRFLEPKCSIACLWQQLSGHYLCLLWRLKTSCQISHFTHWKHEMWPKTFHISHNRLTFNPAVARCRLCHSRTVTKVKTSVFVNKSGLLNIPDLTSGGSSMWSDVLGHTYFLLFLPWFIHPPATTLRMSGPKPPPYYFGWSWKYEYFSKL